MRNYYLVAIFLIISAGNAFGQNVLTIYHDGPIDDPFSYRRNYYNVTYNVESSPVDSSNAAWWENMIYGTFFTSIAYSANCGIDISYDASSANLVTYDLVEPHRTGAHMESNRDGNIIIKFEIKFFRIVENEDGISRQVL